MLFGEAISIALQSLRANKLRSLLTVLGILIGVSSVIAVVAITEGLDRYMSDKVLELGTKAFRLQRRPDIITSHEQWMEMMKRKRLNMDDYEAVQKACTLCSEVGAQVWTGSNVKRGRTIQKNVGIAGITENIARIGTIRELVAGRHIVQQDVDPGGDGRRSSGRTSCDAFFGTMEPIGKEIDIDGHPIKVIGVAEKKGAVFGESQDNFVWMPITTFQKFYGSRRSFSIQAEAQTMAVFEAAQDQVRVAMRARRHLTYNKPDNFNIETGETVMELWQTMTRGIYVVTFVVTAISLLVGGIVVMNIMLVSVTERIKEIGVRKALGARRGRHPAAVPRRVGDPLRLRRLPRGPRGRRLLLRAGEHPRQHDVRQLLGPGAPVGGRAGARRLVDRGPRGRDLPREPRGRARPRRGPEERVMLRIHRAASSSATPS